MRTLHLQAPGVRSRNRRTTLHKHTVSCILGKTENPNVIQSACLTHRCPAHKLHLNGLLNLLLDSPREELRLSVKLIKLPGVESAGVVVQSQTTLLLPWVLFCGQYTWPAVLPLRKLHSTGPAEICNLVSPVYTSSMVDSKRSRRVLTLSMLSASFMRAMLAARLRSASHRGGSTWPREGVSASASPSDICHCYEFKTLAQPCKLKTRPHPHHVKVNSHERA